MVTSPHALAKLEPIDTWHVDIEQDAVRLEAVDHGQRLGAVVRGANLIAIEFEHQRKRGGSVFQVVDHHQSNRVIAHGSVSIQPVRFDVAPWLTQDDASAA